MTSRKTTVFSCVALLLSVSLFSCNSSKKPKEKKAVLPAMEINTKKAIDWHKKTKASVTYKDGRDSVVAECTVKFRGGASSKYPKHSYAVKFAEKYSLCGLPATKSWILNANYIDKTFMRHKICYDLFRQMGDYNRASRCAYVRVLENNSPQGLYVLMQRLTRSVLNVDKLDEEAAVFKDPKVFFREMPAKDPADANFHEQTFPEFEKEDRSYMIDSIRDFIQNAPDDKFYSEVGELFDLRNVVDWHLLLLFTNNGDGVLKNFYLYRQDSETPFRIAVWDCDHSFGRDGDNEKNMLEHTIGERRNILFDRLLNNKSYVESLAGRWKQLRDSGVFSLENISRMMAENDKYIRLGLQENASLWPFDSEFYFDSAGYDEECGLMTEFVRMNLRVLDERFGYSAK